MIKVDLKGSEKEFESGVSVAEVAKSIGMGLYKSACAAKVNGEVCDLRTVLNEDCKVEILTFDDKEGKKAYWHTASHIMAQAVNRLYPGTKFAIGPAVDNGFYYDMELPQAITNDDLAKIEAEMKKIIKEDIEIERFELPVAEALELMKGQDYKEELIREHAAEGEHISFYKQDDFTDLCAGPHLMRTGNVKAVKLTSITGAYWRGDASNKMLQRLYGIAFPKQSLLEEHLTMMEEAKKRDHNTHTLQLNLPGRRGTMCFDCMKRGGQLSMLHIVLVEPEIPQNCGNVARTCAATGSQLHLIRPLGFDISEKAVRRAGLDYWNLVEVFDYENLEDFFRRRPEAERDLWLTTTKAPRSYQEAQFTADSWLFFGKETAGLPLALRERYRDRCVRLPMVSEARSLNLSNTVAVCVYEALRQNGFPGLLGTGEMAWG